MDGQRNRGRNSYGDSRPSIPPSNEVYVVNLPQDIAEENVRQIFQDHGHVNKVNIKKKDDGFTFAFVRYENEEMAGKAIEMLNNVKIGDKVVKVSYAKGRTNNSNPNERNNQGNQRPGFRERRPRGDMDSSTEMSHRSNSGERNFDNRGRGRGRGGDRGDGRGRGNMDRQSDARKKFGNNQQRQFDNRGPRNRDRSSQGRGGNYNRDERTGNRGGDRNNMQRGGDRKPNTCFKCHEPGHRANQCPNNGDRPSNNTRKVQKMSEDQFEDY